MATAKEKANQRITSVGNGIHHPTREIFAQFAGDNGGVVNIAVNRRFDRSSFTNSSSFSMLKICRRWVSSETNLSNL
jgi:hypothetical protein